MKISNSSFGDIERGAILKCWEELDTKLMNPVKPISSGASVKKDSHFCATAPMQASFCGEHGSKMGLDDYNEKLVVLKWLILRK